ncbi:MAG: methylenetetrahydrofolate reductase C-terminal domain-containing protein [Syntrophales bacterium]|nr:methylenetetrahydrofolate reductase C-terminal domain-containing protein [Syntrophales bacterium]
MIVANRKPLEEILEMVKPYKKILLLGCNECVTVCAVGGQREVGVLASELRLSRAKDGDEVEIKEHTLERQCDYEYIDQIRPFVGDYELILSMACGAGVQYVAETYRSKLVVPAVNTTFLGVTLEQGVWSERCQGCGSCILDKTGGICPIARCAKSLLNGPCGGSSGGKCEIDKEVDCGWQLIIDRLQELGQMDRYEEIIPVKDWTTARDGGPRKRVREDLRL